MRQVFVLVSGIALLAAGAATAQERRAYLGGELGLVASSQLDLDVTPAATLGSTGRFETETEIGLQGAIFAGYDFGRIRVEVEASRMQADLDRLSSNFALGQGLVSGGQDVTGDLSSTAVMANLILDAGSYRGFEFFAGVGAGKAEVEVSNLSLSNGVVLLDDGDTEWQTAWQLMAGVRKPVAANLELHLRYRYLQIKDSERIGLSGRVMDGGFSAHTVSAGLSYRFW